MGNRADEGELEAFGQTGDGVAVAEREEVDERVSEDDFVDFRGAGEAVEGEFRCVSCAYGAVVTESLPECPMCRSSTWERVRPSAVGGGPARVRL